MVTQRRILTSGRVLAAMLAVVLLVAGGARAQDGVDTFRAQTLGVLVHGRVDVNFDKVPLEQAVDELKKALGINLIARYDDADSGVGLDPAAPVTLAARNISGLDALEMLIDQATLFDSCTWQMRSGIVEIGSKQKLARKAEQHAYPITDFLLEPPYFVPGGRSASSECFDKHPYRSGSLKIGEWKSRYTPKELGEELIRAMAETIEPGNWDFQLTQLPPTGANRGKVSGPYHSADNRIARIRTWDDDQVFLVAPDYFHRQVAGEEKLIVPTPGHFARMAEDQPGVRFVGIDRSAKLRSAMAAPIDEAAQTQRGQAGHGVIDGASVGKAFRDRVHHTLETRQIDLVLDEVPPRQAFAAFAERVGFPVIVRCDDDPLGYGINAVVPISLDMRSANALDVLEELLDLCTVGRENCTWQVRRGYVEVGTKARLNAPAALTLRLYHVRDLMFEPGTLPVCAGLDLLQLIVEVVEPGSWDYGQIEYYNEDQQPGVINPVKRRSGQGGGAAGNPPNRRMRGQSMYNEARLPAIIRHWRDVMIVSAPDYIHRQLGDAMD